MTVAIAGKPIQNPGNLSDLARTVLAFIDGGMEWLAWAVASPSVRHDFPDETALAATVQFNLHASRFALLPSLGLCVSPVKLMTLGLADLRTLAHAEGGDNSPRTEAQVRRICDSNRLATQEDLAAGTALLDSFGMAKLPVFQILDFDDRLALHELAQLTSAGDASLGQEAAAFAVEQARTPLEFVDYCRYYLALAGKDGASGDTPDGRRQRAESALQTLLPLLFDDLGGPELSVSPVFGSPPAYEVASALDDFFSRGGRVGFSRLSEGARQIAEWADYRGETGPEAKQLVARYVAGAVAFLASRPSIQGFVGQDGACRYTVAGGAGRAELRLGMTGVLTLGECRLPL
ncbi:MAG TPA: hypothetical protein VFF03_00285 [Rhodocyclaceae bacterium]|nr:hypothetical protein [Rhodocyclaceae bacterium]